MVDTVVDEATGQVVPVKQVHASAAIVIASSMAGDMPDDAATRIEQAMAGAAANCHAAGITDPDQIRASMLLARDSVKLSMSHEQRDLRSQEAAQDK